jgi:phosphoribosylformimino-5-aminoimidazole carboxamide ribotide isomerase
MFTIIPAIDLLDGKVVRLTQGDYNQVDHYSYQPEELAKIYEDAGATRIHIVDLNGAKEGQLVNLEVIKKIREAVSCEIELGGGIRTKETVATLLNIGINYVILGSVLIKDPELTFSIIKDYPNKIIAGIDAKEENVAIEGWLEKSNLTISDLIKTLESKAVASIVYTDIQRDGMMIGPNLESLKKVASQTDIPIIASGGVSCIQDISNIKQLKYLGVNACIVGKAILSNAIDITKLF